MAYKHVELDLRLKHHRTRKDYWRGVREGRIPWPKYTKPRLFRIKLDPEQALITQCRIAATGWMTMPWSEGCNSPGAGPAGDCNIPVRGRHHATGNPFHVDHELHYRPS